MDFNDLKGMFAEVKMKMDGAIERVRREMASVRTGRATVSLPGVAAGRHRVVLTAGDYQELKNMENVPQILPNTRTFRTTFAVG